MIKVSVLAIFVSVCASAQWANLNPLLSRYNPYLKVGDNGALLKPDSNAGFKSTSTGWDSNWDSLKRINSGKNSYYFAFPKSPYGNGSLVEASNGEMVAVTSCNGNFKPNNTEGVKCATLSVKSCTTLMKNFSNLENPAMSNPVVASAFKDSKDATDGSFIEKFKMNLRQCDDAMMLVNNMEGSGDGFPLDAKHKKILEQNVQSYPIQSIGNVYNEKVRGAMLSVLGKAEIFSKCAEVIKADQIAKKRTTFLPADAAVAPAAGASQTR